MRSLVIALVLLTQAVSGYATAGIVYAVTCCCPSIDDCKCHDHDEPASSDPRMQRCGGSVEVIAIASLEGIAAEPPRVIAGVSIALGIESDVASPYEAPPSEPETPPF